MNQARSTILLADDDPDDRLLIEEALQESGSNSELVTVDDGDELLDFLRCRGKYSKVTALPRAFLVLLDLNMPGKDGRTALREIKSDPKLRHIPIVVLTTSNSSEDIRATYEMGGNSFIIKPNSFLQMVEMLKMLSKYWFDVTRLAPVQHARTR
jgi:CheY-like chemotaxis protein